MTQPSSDVRGGSPAASVLEDDDTAVAALIQALSSAFAFQRGADAVGDSPREVTGPLGGVRLRARIASATQSVSEMLRNWSPQIPWDDLARFDDASAPTTPMAEDQLSGIIEALTALIGVDDSGSETSSLEELALEKNAYDFYRPAGANLLIRTQDYHD